MYTWGPPGECNGFMKRIRETSIRNTVEQWDGETEREREREREVEGITLSSPRSPIPSEAITILGTSSKEFLISVYNVDCSDNTAVAVAKSWEKARATAAAEVQF